MSAYFALQPSPFVFPFSLFYFLYLLTIHFTFFSFSFFYLAPFLIRIFLLCSLFLSLPFFFLSTSSFPLSFVFPFPIFIISSFHHPFFPFISFLPSIFFIPSTFLHLGSSYFFLPPIPSLSSLILFLSAFLFLSSSLPSVPYIAFTFFSCPSSFLPFLFLPIPFFLSSFSSLPNGDSSFPCIRYLSAGRGSNSLV